MTEGQGNQVFTQMGENYISSGEHQYINGEPGGQAGTQIRGVGKKNTPKRNKLGIRRPKLVVRRHKTKGLVIKENTDVPTQASHIISNVSRTISHVTSTGIEKI